jgi:membrane protein insertase Oxa1/YidC/SpoIIIJ
MDLGQPPNPVQWWSYALPVLVLITYWLQQKVMTPPTSSDDQSQAAMMNRQMQIMMPLMMMFFTLQDATGLSIYFIISSLIRIAQYFVVQRDRGEEQGKSKA